MVRDNHRTSEYHLRFGGERVTASELSAWHGRKNRAASPLPSVEKVPGRGPSHVHSRGSRCRTAHLADGRFDPPRASGDIPGSEKTSVGRIRCEKRTWVLRDPRRAYRLASGIPDSLGILLQSWSSRQRREDSSPLSRKDLRGIRGRFPREFPVPGPIPPGFSPCSV